jgi:uncharacterized membrane protein YdjX (TVP38/TMEM64 family)
MLNPDDPDPIAKKGKILGAALGLVILGCALFFVRSLMADERSMTPEALRAYLLGFGPAAFGIYVLLYTLCTVSIFPPIGLISLPAGFIFGPARGAAAIMAGAFVGASLTFLISRLLGADGSVTRFLTGHIAGWVGGRVTPRFAGRMEEFRRRVSREGFTAVLFLRLVPVLPWELVNYAAGLTGIGYGRYITATMLGIVPSVLVQAFFSDRISRHGASALRGDLHSLIGDPVFVAAAVGFLIMLLVPSLVMLRRRRTRLASARTSCPRV